MIRFSSVSVPFADRVVALAAGEVLPPERLAALVALNAAPEAVAVVCPDRPTLLAATKAFGVAVRAGAPTAAAVVPATPVRGRFAALDLNRLRPVSAPSSPSAAASLAERWGTVVDGQAATIAALQAEVAALTAALEVALAPKPVKPRRSRAKAAPQEGVSDDGLSTY